MRQQIHTTSVHDCVRASECMMDEEIKGTSVLCHHLRKHDVRCFAPCDGFARIIIFLSGAGTAESEGNRTVMNENDVYVQKPDMSVSVRTGEEAIVVELIRRVTEQEFGQFSGCEQLPYLASYQNAKTYREECKSEKTINRMLIPARIVPRFAMGSVETSGVDRVEPHSHPMLDQFFLGMRDNHCTVIADGQRQRFESGVLLHIPLGSNHGVVSEQEDCVRYYWMDFLFDEEGLAYMDSAHEMEE